MKNIIRKILKESEEEFGWANDVLKEKPKIKITVNNPKIEEEYRKGWGPYLDNFNEKSLSKYGFYLYKLDVIYSNTLIRNYYFTNGDIINGVGDNFSYVRDGEVVNTGIDNPDITSGQSLCNFIMDSIKKIENG